MVSNFKGVMPALVTPLTKDEKINVSTLEKLLNHLIKQGSGGFYIGGATGEGLLLDVEQRKILCEKSIEFIGKDRTKIVHITDMNFRNTIELAKHAEACGADAISAIAPTYFRYDEDDIYEYYKAIAESVNIPLIIYYTLAANVNMSNSLFRRMFEVDNITGVKWTNSNYYELIKLRNDVPDVNIFNGPDEMLICGLSAGADGGIGTTYNFMYPLINEIYTHFKANDIDSAREAQKKADKIINAVIKHVTIPATKIILEEMGFDVGYASFPMKKYSPEMRKVILSDVREAGLEI